MDDAGTRGTAYLINFTEEALGDVTKRELLPISRELKTNSDSKHNKIISISHNTRILNYHHPSSANSTTPTK